MRYMREVEINWEIWFSSSGKHSIFTALGAEKNAWKQEFP